METFLLHFPLLSIVVALLYPLLLASHVSSKWHIMYRERLPGLMLYGKYALLVLSTVLKINIDDQTIK